MSPLDFFISPFEYSFMRNALCIVLIAGILAPITGFWALNRRMVYLMDAMSHSVLPGVILAAMFGVSYLSGGLIAALVLTIIVFYLTRKGRAPEDGAIGVGSQSLFALGIILASQSSEHRSFMHILFGNPFASNSSDIALMLITAVITLLLIISLQSKLIAATFDHEHAEAIGVKVIRIDLVLILALAATTVVGLSSVGVLMTVSLAVTPAVTMRVLQISFMKARYGAVLMGILAGTFGILLSYHLGIPVGPTVALLCLAILSISVLYMQARDAGILTNKKVISP